MIRLLAFTILLFSIKVQAADVPPDKAACEAAAMNKTNQDAPLREVLAQARARQSEIGAAVSALTGTEKKYFELVDKAVEAALTKHQAEFDKERHWDELDVARHMTILRAIAGFNSEDARFSLYKIKRAIEGRHSLSEYAKCK